MERQHAVIAILFVGSGFLVGCGSTGVVPAGRDTYMLAKPGGFFTIAGGEVKADLYREADAYCRRVGKSLMPVSSSSRDAGPFRHASAEITFRCLKENDPQYGRPTMAPAPDIKVDVQTKP